MDRPQVAGPPPRGAGSDARSDGSIVRAAGLPSGAELWAAVERDDVGSFVELCPTRSCGRLHGDRLADLIYVGAGRVRVILVWSLSDRGHDQYRPDDLEFDRIL